MRLWLVLISGIGLGLLGCGRTLPESAATLLDTGAAVYVLSPQVREYHVGFGGDRTGFFDLLPAPAASAVAFAPLLEAHLQQGALRSVFRQLAPLHEAETDTDLRVFIDAVQLRYDALDAVTLTLHLQLKLNARVLWTQTYQAAGHSVDAAWLHTVPYYGPENILVQATDSALTTVLRDFAVDAARSLRLAGFPIRQSGGWYRPAPRH